MRVIGRACALAAALCVAAPGLAETISGTVQLRVVQAVGLSNLEDLEFGVLMPSATAGRVRINPTNGNRTTFGGVTAAGALYSAARFQVTGDPNERVQITIPSSPITITGSNGGTMQVRRFRRERLTPNAPRLDAGGALEFAVGATLRVGANQTPGRYTGTFVVQVEYQ